MRSTTSTTRAPGSSVASTIEEQRFIHLRVHSHYSFLDGASSVEALVARAAALGMPALAISDNDGLYGAVKLRNAARAAGLKPMYGATVLVDGYPLALLAESRAGYANLSRLLTEAHGVGPQQPSGGPAHAAHDIPRGPFRNTRDEQPHLSLESVAARSGGLIALSGQRDGAIGAALLEHRSRHALTAASALRDAFGPDRFWIELQNHLLLGDDDLNARLVNLSRYLGVGVVATNDVHYATVDGYRLHDVMTCIRTRTRLDDGHPARLANSEYSLKTAVEMAALFPEHPEALRATLAIAERCFVDVGNERCLPPRFPVPAGETPFSYLYQLCHEGLRQRYCPITPVAFAQLAHELDVIERLHLAEFFLCVWDIVRFARENGVRCAGRGSAADSIVAYVLGITAVDPIEHKLLFARFLHEEMADRMPDIDVDFDSRRRDEVIAYIERTYSEEHAAMVANVVTYQPRLALREVAKVLGYSDVMIDHLAQYVGRHSDDVSADILAAPPPQGTGGYELQGTKVTGCSLSATKVANYNWLVARGEPTGQQVAAPVSRTTLPLSTAVERGPGGEAAPLVERGSGREDLAALCAQIIGAPRHLSVHNGGMLITREPLPEIVPVEYATKGMRVCQFNKDDVEALGLIKFDVLGLRNLTIVSEAQEMIRRRQPSFDIDALAMNDEAAYQLLRSAKTIGVFQVESPGQWNLLARIQPTCFNDLVVQVALFRPGPLQGKMVNPYVERRQGRQPVTYPHPLLEPVLRDTLGIILFQEQVLEIAHTLAGLSYGEADAFRRAMSHHRSKTEMRRIRDRFVEGAVGNGVERALAETIHGFLENFSGYGFCRSHAAAFARTVYQTAYLKAHHPAELLAAILSNEPCDFFPPMVMLEEAKHWGIRTLPVDINRSTDRFTVRNGAIRISLAQVKGVSEETAQRIIAARAETPFMSLEDFHRRTFLDRPIIENLIAVGAFDSLGVPRRTVLWRLEEVIRALGAERGRRDTAPLLEPPVPGVDEIPPLPDLSAKEALDIDHQLQGMSANYHILALHRSALTRMRALPILEMRRLAAGQRVRFAGMIVSHQRPPTANGMAFIVFADDQSEIQAAVDPATYNRARPILRGGESLFLVAATVQRQGRAVSVMLRDVWPLREALNEGAIGTSPALGL